MNQNDLAVLLRPLDAASRPDDTDRRRRDAMLERVLAAPAAAPERAGAVAAKRRPFVRFALGGVAAVLLAPAVVIGATQFAQHPQPVTNSAGPGAFTKIQLASWVTTPTPRSAASLSSAVQRWCTSATDAQAGAGASVGFSNADQRGRIASAIITRGSYRDLCVAGDGGAGTWEIIDGPGIVLPAVGARAVALQSAGSQGDGGASIDTVWGQAGSDVTKMVLHVEGDPRPITATVGDGIWSAWWPSGEVHGDAPKTATVTYRDGRTATVEIPAS